MERSRKSWRGLQTSEALRTNTPGHRDRDREADRPTAGDQRPPPRRNRDPAAVYAGFRNAKLDKNVCRSEGDAAVRRGDETEELQIYISINIYISMYIHIYISINITGRFGCGPRYLHAVLSGNKSFIWRTAGLRRSAAADALICSGATK